MSLQLSQRVQRVTLSANAAAKSRVTELREAGRDILDLTTGEPDFDTSEHIKQAAYAAIERGATKYTATPGVKALRLAIQRKLQGENRLDYALGQIVVGNGAKGIIFNAFAATLDRCLIGRRSRTACASTAACRNCWSARWNKTAS
jgi:aspartate aminotransferase